MGNGQSFCSENSADEYEYLNFVQENMSHLRQETYDARKARYLNSFEPKVDNLKVCTRQFVDELITGLNLHKANPGKPIDMAVCNFKMLDAFCPRAPNGSEDGVYYAIDFGGSNFRVVRCHLTNGNVDISAKKASLSDVTGELKDLPKGLLDPKCTATQLFDFFAGIAKEFMTENGDIHSVKPLPLGFTFSYPCSLKSLGSADLMVWTKGFETGRQTNDPVEGCDVAALMNAAFKRNNVPLFTNCVANDTVGTLLSSGYTLPKGLPAAAVGVILGTGMNACYVDPVAPEHGFNGTIINTECGNFQRSLPRNNVDFEIDYNDVAGRGVNILEKMMSGGYLGELCRRAIVKILQYEAVPAMWVVDSFDSGLAASCVQDDSADRSLVAAAIRKAWGVKLGLEHLQMIHEVCEVVFRRSAALSAVVIAACAIKTGQLASNKKGCSVGIDGSLFKCNEFFRKNIDKYLVRILGNEKANMIRIVDAEDGSGLGAAILSAIAVNP